MMGASMGDVVNLRRFKKRTKRANDLLDQHRIDGEDAS